MKSIIVSVLIHIAISAAVVAYFKMRTADQPAPENYVDLGYETFDTPPVPAVEVKRVVKSPTPQAPPDKAAVPDNSPKEIQDEKGEVAGTQVAKVENNLGSESDGTAATTPFYKIKPKYPKAALVSGTEGWILLEIDITETGEVENVRVVGGQPREMFQSEARRAVSQWKYRPFVDAEGKPYRKVDHQVRVDFKLEDQYASKL